jgi:hypothetical protein
VNGTLDTNDKNSNSAEFDITGLSRIGVYLFHNTGPHSKQKVMLQISPNGTNWVDVDYICVKCYLNADVVGQKARLRVKEAQGVASLTDYYFVGQ